MLEPGTLLLNRYEILKPIGQGGMGAVYLARDQRLGNTVALKETFFTDSLLLAAFEREARLLAGLRHPALPKVMDHFADGSGQFLVMEFIPGDDLQDLLTATAGAFQPEEGLQWADQILDALDYLHSQNPPIIHRDIKPQNLKLTSRNQVVLLDFGLAKSAASANATSVTDSGKSIFAYTPNYAPLEQIQGAGTDAQSDLYSLGATLYHLMTGVRPVDALTRASTVLNGKEDPLTPASALNPKVTPDVGEVIAQAMSLNRDRRPAAAVVMRRMMRNAAQASTGDAAAEDQTVLTHQGVKPALKASSPSEDGRKTDAKGSPPAPTVCKPTEAKYTRPNSPAQTAWGTTPAWPAAPAQPLTHAGHPTGKMVAVAIVLILVAGLAIFSLNRKSQPGAGESISPAHNGSDTLRVSTPPEAQETPAATAAEIPRPSPSPPITSQPAPSQEAVSQPSDEEAPSPSTSEAAQKTDTAEAKRVEKRDEERPASTETRPALTPAPPGPEQERRPPPPPPDAHPRHPWPPPPHGMPPPRRRP